MTTGPSARLTIISEQVSRAGCAVVGAKSVCVRTTASKLILAGVCA
jgi:hypothetical protein